MSGLETISGRCVAVAIYGLSKYSLSFQAIRAKITYFKPKHVISTMVLLEYVMHIWFFSVLMEICLCGPVEAFLKFVGNSIDDYLCQAKKYDQNYGFFRIIDPCLVFKRFKGDLSL